MPLKDDWVSGNSFTANDQNDVADAVNSVQARTFHVDDYGADPTGVNASDTAVAAAITAMGTSPGILEFGVGTYKLNSTKTLAYPGQGIRGAGSSATTLDFRGTGDCLRVWDSTVPTNGLTPPLNAGPITGFYITAINNANSNIVGMHVGDIFNLYINDVMIKFFDNAGSVGFWGLNRYTAAEGAFISMDVRGCTDNYLFETHASHPLGTSTWDYGWFFLRVGALANQNGVVLKNYVQMEGVFFSVVGNFLPAATNTGVGLTVGTDASDLSYIRGVFAVSVETTGTGTTYHTDCNTGDLARIEGSGQFAFHDYGGAWSAGTASRLTTALSGRVSTPSLGRPARNQAFTNSGVFANLQGAHTVVGSTATFYLDMGNQHFYQLPNGASTIAFDIDANLVDQAAVYDFLLAQPGSGAAGTVTWPSIFWLPAGGAAPSLASTNGHHNNIRLVTTDHVTFFGVKLA